MVTKRKPGRKPKLHPTDHPVLSVFPSLNMRQASILLQCVALGMAHGISVDTRPVQAGEWEAIIKQLIRH